MFMSIYLCTGFCWQ